MENLLHNLKSLLQKDERLISEGELLNVHPNTLRNWDNNGVLKAIRFGSRRDRRYKKSDIFKLIKK